MSYNKISDFIGGSRRLHDQVRAIKGALQKKAPASSRTCQRLFHQLGETCQNLQALKDKASSAFAKSQLTSLNELDDTIKGLYGTLLDKHVNSRVSHIVKGADAAAAGIVTPIVIKNLKKQISLLQKEHRLSVPNRKLIREAEENLTKAEENLMGNGKEKIHHHFDILAQECNVRFLEEVLPGEIEELFEIGRYVYEGKISAAKQQYHQLPYRQKEQFEKHMHFLGAVPFKDRTETIQAFHAIANESIDNGEIYPSSEKIDEFYLGLRQVLDIESPPDKVFSFKSNGSYR